MVCPVNSKEMLHIHPWKPSFDLVNMFIYTACWYVMYVWEWGLMLFAAISTAVFFFFFFYWSHLFHLCFISDGFFPIHKAIFKWTSYHAGKLLFEDLISDFSLDAVNKWKSRPICLNGWCQDANWCQDDNCECWLYKSILRQNSIWQPPLLSMSSCYFSQPVHPYRPLSSCHSHFPLSPNLVNHHSLSVRAL